jgi:hypothetical protein
MVSAPVNKQGNSFPTRTREFFVSLIIHYFWTFAGVKRVRSGLPAEALSQLGVGPSGVSTTGSFAAVSLLIRVHKFSIKWVVNVV